MAVFGAQRIFLKESMKSLKFTAAFWSAGTRKWAHKRVDALEIILDAPNCKASCFFLTFCIHHLYRHE
jgi:hypothetical protein